MKKIISTVVLAMLITNSALAAKKSVDSPWYIQASFGEVFETDAEEQALKDLNKLGYTVESMSFDNSKNSYQVELGYQMSEHWAVTAGYVDFGDTDFDVQIDTPNADLLVNDIEKAAPRFGDGNTFGLVYSYKVIPEVVLSLDGGVLFLESEYNTQVNVGSDDEPVFYKQTTKDSSVQWYASAGVSYLFDKLEVGVYYRYYDIDHVNSQWLGARLGYHF
ncbi:outer membrane beta-barrel protein [Thalassotalea fonticola]|uniref:Outer membrane beta-barrel protein n=1 Tax=Thalassotalea fonticola TaxID=3065649 RepID=A0ABZ0GRY6_9GAMM|nr:outer membrane beta-barrel protein [Colwelliaceae bacterium S1-1]